MYKLKPQSLVVYPSAELLAKIDELKGFDSQATFNSFCRSVIAATKDDKVSTDYKDFGRMLESIEHRQAHTISTSWGGVVVTSHTHPYVEKFLVVRKGSFLAFEKHADKIETLMVDEGVGVLVYRDAADTDLSIAQLTKGYEVTFQPGQEHCIIATQDLLVFERSIEPKGMDKDLIFIFTPE